MKALRVLFAVLLCCAGASCTSLLELDDYSAPGGARCVAGGPLACLVSKCEPSASKYVLGDDPMNRDFTNAACPDYVVCLCACTDAACAKACDSRCSGTGSTSLLSSCPVGAADCGL